MQASMYFYGEHFKTSVPLVITAMLVMYTLRASISKGLPKTSYVTFIDVWLLNGQIQPFIIVLTIVLIEHIPNHRKVLMKVHIKLNIYSLSVAGYSNLLCRKG